MRTELAMSEGMKRALARRPDGGLIGDGPRTETTKARKDRGMRFTIIVDAEHDDGPARSADDVREKVRQELDMLALDMDTDDDGNDIEDYSVYGLTVVSITASIAG
jgi:hypothetical protein